MIQHLESHGIRKITVYPEIDGGTNSLGLVSIALPSDMLQSQTGEKGYILLFYYYGGELKFA